MKKCRLHLLGLPTFNLIVDHQPLVTILDKYTLNAVENPRLQRMKEKMSPFVFKTIWRKGKEHSIPDALSRAPIADPSPEDLEDDAITVHHIRPVLASKAAAITSENEDAVLPPPHLADPLLDDLRTAASADADYMALVHAIENGFPADRKLLPPAVRQYWSVRNDLWTDEGLAMKDARIIIPAAKRSEVRAKLHAAHQGIERLKRRARQLVYWPGLNSDLVNTVNSCEACQTALPSQQREPMMSDPPPSRVFEDVSVDLFAYSGNHFLVYADRLSGWTTVDAWIGRDLCTRDVIWSLRRNFIDFGVPVRIRTDGGLQFASQEFAKFAEKWDVKHVKSTPHYPQSNGHAESAVKAMKSLLIKTSPNGNLDKEEFQIGLLEFRNTPKAHGLSPAQVLFGHPLRSPVPAHHTTFAKSWRDMMHACEQAAAKGKQKIEEQYNSHARALPPLKPGTSVRIQDPKSKLWDTCGTIISVGKSRDYHVKLASGRVYWRNRRYIRPNTVIENGGEEKVDPAAITDSVPQAKRRRGRPRRQDNKPAAEPSRRSSRIKHPPSRYGNS